VYEKGAQIYTSANIGSISLLCIALLYHQRKRFVAALFFVSAEIVIYTTIFICFSGIATHIAVFYSIVILTHSAIPYIGKNMDKNIVIAD